MDNNLTEIVFLLDRSGSMAGLEANTIQGFNEFIGKQAGMAGKTMVTAVLFDDEYEVLWNGIDAASARLTEKEYYVRGNTALLDAIGKTILDLGCRLSKTEDARRPGKVIVVITTDGQENSSSEFTYKKVKELIRHQQDKYSWEFIFMGANIDVVREAGNIGICQQNAYRFASTQEGVAGMYDTVSCAVAEKRAPRRT